MLIYIFQNRISLDLNCSKQNNSFMKKIFFLGIFVLATINGIAQTSNPIKFTAKIANRNSDTLVIRGANQFVQTIPINNKNLFVASFEAPKGFYQLSDGTEVSNLYLKPDSEINLTMDAKEFDETILYKGKGVNESNFLAKYSLKEEKFQETAFAKEQNEFLSLFEAKKKAELEDIEKGDYDAEFKAIIKSSLENSYQYTLQAYESASKMNKFKGVPSPDFDYQNYNGNKTKLSDLKGKYVYIDLWATWCGPCRAEIPYLQKLEKKYHGKNIEFVSVSIDKVSDTEKWKKFVSDKNLGGIQVIADKDWQSDFVMSYKVTGIPRFILLDTNGNILEADAPRPSSDKLIKKIDALLN